MKGESTQPWQHMTQTYTWVVEQEYVTSGKPGRKTEQWVTEQQVFLATAGHERPRRTSSVRREVWDHMVRAYEVEADRWMRYQEKARRQALEREQEKVRLMQEEIRRNELRMRQKKEAEKRRLAEEKARAHAEYFERERRVQARAERAVVEAWSKYEDRWTSLSASTSPLTFATMPWPMVSAPANLEAITPTAIVLFLLSPLHSQGQSRKERIRNAQLRWHPDRFRRFIGRVVNEDRAAVEEGVGIIARCLNDLMARESRR